MGLSMASMFAQVMQNSFNNTARVVAGNDAAPPPKYIYAIIEGAQKGPFSLGEIAEFVRAGSVTLDTFIWKPGMQEWKQAKDVADIGFKVESTPPQMPEL